MQVKEKSIAVDQSGQRDVVTECKQYRVLNPGTESDNWRASEG